MVFNTIFNSWYLNKHGCIREWVNRHFFSTKLREPLSDPQRNFDPLQNMGFVGRTYFSSVAYNEIFKNLL